MAEVQPGLHARFTHGTFTPGWYSIADPRLYTLALAERVTAQGGTLIRSEAQSLAPGEAVVTVHCTDGVEHRAGKVVVAAGAFSRQLARTVGDRIPLDTERGYNTTLPSDAFDLRMQITFGGHGFVISRLSTGIRIGGAVELGGLKRAPNFKRSEAMLAKAAQFLPGLRTNGGTQWMGFRPSLPDSLPVIGRSRASPRVIHAFGHGHLGLTQSAGTARLVADLVTGQQPAFDLTPFSPQRF
jgi:D-amino-acid dehydrogenase